MNSIKSKEEILNNLNFVEYYKSVLSLSSLPISRPDIVTLCPFHPDTKPSLSIDLSTGRYNCYGNCSTPTFGSVFDFHMKLYSCTYQEALQALTLFLTTGANKPMLTSKEPTNIYSYLDENSNLVFQVCKYADERKFLQRRPKKDGSDGWVWNLKGVQPILYNLPNLSKAPKDDVYIVEGEKDADRLIDLGYLATCNPFGAGKWRDEYNKYFKDRIVVIIPDNDLVGKKHAEQIASSLYDFAKEIKIYFLPRLQEKQDVSDWLDKGYTEDNLLDLYDSTPIWEPPLSLLTSMNDPNWPVLRSEALDGIAGEFVELATEHSEADPVAVLINFLVRFGIEIGSNPRFSVGDTFHYPRLYAAIVGKSAKARKGTSAATTKRLFEFTLFSGYRSANSIPGPLSTGEGLIYQVRDKNEQDDGVEDKRLFVLEEELGSAFKAASREGNTLSATLRRLWDEGSAAPITKKDRTRATNAHVGIVAHITLDELKQLLNSVDIHNGFANRFLWCCARRTRLVSRPKRTNSQKLYNFQIRVLKRINAVSNFKEFSFDESAQKLWDTGYKDLSEDSEGEVGSVIARSEVQVIRLALIYALLDCSDNISEGHLRSALAVWDYCKDSAKYIFSK
jgi:hypothetical protein